MPFVLSIFMSGIVSFIATLRAMGITPELANQWLQSWFLSWAIAFPTLFVVMPLTRRIVAALVEAPGKN